MTNVLGWMSIKPATQCALSKLYDAISRDYPDLRGVQATMVEVDGDLKIMLQVVPNQ